MEFDVLDAIISIDIMNNWAETEHVNLDNAPLQPFETIPMLH